MIGPTPLWTPTRERREATALHRFALSASQRVGRDLTDYDQLHAWSVADTAGFWQMVWDEAGIIASQPATSVVQGESMRRTTWFQGARLNYAENLLRWDDDHIALVALDETGARSTVSYRELRQQVASLAATFRTWNLQPGDRVAAILPNRVEAVIGMLAAASLGATWSSCSPDFGFQGIMDRFGQIRPRVLIGARSYRYGGRDYDTTNRILRVASEIDSIEHAIVVAGSAEGIPNGVAWDSVCTSNPAELVFEQLPFDHPLYVMYSSGTTGVPKCIVHGAGGTLVQHAKEHRLHCDLGREDVLFYFTTCGWMMWNWLVGGLQAGCTLVLFDGNPATPNIGALWEHAATEGITVFGTSPKFVAGCKKAELTPGASPGLPRLRAILSTGSPLSDELFAWLYTEIKADLQVASICGGTDIISCFMLGSPVSPVYAGEIQKRGLGMAVEAWTADGRHVVGEKAELVCTRAFPSMPVGFYGDEDGARYDAAYFQRFPGVWTHGDFVEVTERGGVIVYGRSDATLNPGGVRIGTAEIYRIVESLDAVRDSLVVGQRFRGDTRIVLFVVPTTTLTEDLVRTIRAAVRKGASPRHVPAKVLSVAEIPRTISGKKVEIAVTRLIHGEPIANRDAMANPEALEYFAAHRETLTG